MNAIDINRILDIKESYELPDKLLKKLLENDMSLFEKFIELEQDLSFDWFTNYFQEEHSNRNSLKQDFTPKEVCDLVNGVAGKGLRIADICAGTGGLTIKYWNANKDKDIYYHLEEYSNRAIPILLFNLAIRGMNATVVNCDVLSREIFAIYRLTNNGQFSLIEQVDEYDQSDKFDCVIMNPPYSAKWTPTDDDRFFYYGLAPKAKADYAFVLNGLSLLNDSGTLVAVLPHGVLFRGASEGQIRQKLIDDNLLDAVIGLPDKLFLNTAIPTCLFVLKNNRKHKDILFIEASREFEKDRAYNVLTDENVDKILSVVKNRFAVDKYSFLADIKLIQENEYNLNIPRYVDTFEPEPVKPLNELFSEMVEIEKEIIETEKSLFDMMNELVGTNLESDNRLKVVLDKIEELKGLKYESTTD